MAGMKDILRWMLKWVSAPPADTTVRYAVWDDGYKLRLNDSLGGTIVLYDSFETTKLKDGTT